MTSEGRQVRLNILGTRLGRAALRTWAFPLGLQVAAFLGIVLLTLNGWRTGIGAPTEELMTLRKTNLTTLFVWGLWWPAMIGCALLFGRAWCMVCPMELMNRCGAEVARRLGWKRAGLSRIVRAGWVVVAAYLVLQFLVAGLSIHRVPHYTSVMLLSLFALALVTGLVYREPRSFCKGFCPAKALLTTYGRFTPVQLDVRAPEKCASCTGRECVSPERRYRFDARSCPSFLSPWARQPSDNCVMCLECAKSCPHDNVGLGLTRPEATIRRPRPLASFEAAFVMLAAGFVTHEVVGEVKAIEATFHLVPERLHDAVPAVGSGWFEALWFLGLFPLILWSLSAGVARLLGHRGSLRDTLIAAATGAAPVVAVAHLGKAAAKVSSWGGFLPGALQDPVGLDTLRRIAAHTVEAPSSLLGLSLIGWIMLVTTAFMAWRGCVHGRDALRGRGVAVVTGAVLTGVIFAAVFAAWGAM